MRVNEFKFILRPVLPEIGVDKLNDAYVDELYEFIGNLMENFKWETH